MGHMIAGQTAVDVVDGHGLVPLDGECYGETELSELELLAVALADALEARQAGELGGPGLDEVALHRAERRARRADTARRTRVLVTAVGGVA